jgi:uncharacterized membrane protein YdjX (TVP38/TMEM64 family)
VALGCVAAVAAIAYLLRGSLTALWATAWPILADRERCRLFVSGFGVGAPLVFMGIQVLQVVFAPIPGEATGLVGGYLFGTFEGFVYSSIALTVGSWINFMIGRLLGHRYVRRMIPAAYRERMDFLLRHQGIVVILILFIVPGFPKDYLCLFLGISSLPTRVFVLMAGLGRMPGTLMLSLQGASLYNRHYGVLAALFMACLVLIYLAYRFRESLYRWIERQNHGVS